MAGHPSAGQVTPVLLAAAALVAVFGPVTARLYAASQQWCTPPRRRQAPVQATRPAAWAWPGRGSTRATR